MWNPVDAQLKCHFQMHWSQNSCLKCWVWWLLPWRTTTSKPGKCACNAGHQKRDGAQIKHLNHSKIKVRRPTKRAPASSTGGSPRRFHLKRLSRTNTFLLFCSVSVSWPENAASQGWRKHPKVPEEKCWKWNAANAWKREAEGYGGGEEVGRIQKHLKLADTWVFVIQRCE